MNEPTDGLSKTLSTDQVLLDSVFSPPSRQQWVEMALAGLDTRVENGEDALQQLRRTTLEGIPLDVLCDTADMTVTSLPDASFAGAEQQRWDNRLCVRLPGWSAERINNQILEGLQGGITSVELHEIPSDTLANVLQNVQLDIATISLRSGTHYHSAAIALKALAATQNIDESELKCSFNADPIGNLLCAGSNEVSASTPTMATQIEEMARFAVTTGKHTPFAKSVLVDTAVHHNAGASTIEELHAALATATLYLEAMLDAGMNLSEASGQIVFQLAMDADVLLGVAKLRALRALWTHTLRQIDTQTSDQASTFSSRPASIVTETSRRYTSKLEPWNNHLRNLTASTAAFLGNANALIVHPHDAIQRSDDSLDTALGDRMARNIAIILERECGLFKVHDPMAGSYAIENLTQQLMQHTWQSLSSIDTSEGWLDELHSGRWHTRLSHTHRQRITLMEQEQRIAVGVNRFVQNDNNTLTSRGGDTTTSPGALTPVREAETFEQALLQEVTA